MTVRNASSRALSSQTYLGICLFREGFECGNYLGVTDFFFLEHLQEMIEPGISRFILILAGKWVGQVGVIAMPNCMQTQVSDAVPSPTFDLLGFRTETLSVEVTGLCLY